MGGLVFIESSQHRQAGFGRGGADQFNHSPVTAVKVLYWDGQGFCLFAKRLEKGRFVWFITREGSVMLTPAQMSMLLERIDWRAPQRTWVPQAAG